jgi:hypothetical protein
MSDVAASCIWVCVVAVHIPPCTGKNTRCCHITHNNEIFIILISDFSQDIYVLPHDDMQCPHTSLHQKQRTHKYMTKHKAMSSIKFTLASQASSISQYKNLKVVVFEGK